MSDEQSPQAPPPPGTYAPGPPIQPAPGVEPPQYYQPAPGQPDPYAQTVQPGVQYPPGQIPPQGAPAYYPQQPEPGAPAYYPQQPEAGAPGGEKKSRTGLVVLIVVLVLVLLAGGGGAAWYFVIRPKQTPATTTTAVRPTPQPTQPTSRPTGPATMAPGQPYTSPLGFGVVVPQGWSQKLEGNLETFSNNAQDEKFGVVQVVDHGAKDIDPSAFLNQLVGKLQNEQGYRLDQQPQNITYNGVPAVRARVGTVQNGYQVVVEIIALKSPNGHLYQIQNVGSAEYFPSLLQEFKQFEQTFQFTG